MTNDHGLPAMMTAGRIAELEFSKRKAPRRLLWQWATSAANHPEQYAMTTSRTRTALRLLVVVTAYAALVFSSGLLGRTLARFDWPSSTIAIVGRN